MTVNLSWIRQQVLKEEYIISLHADDERRADFLELSDIESALLNGQILEEYPQDPRGSSCLVYGTSRGRDIHIVCGENAADWLVIITIYIPTMPKWGSPTRRNKI